MLLAAQQTPSGIGASFEAPSVQQVAEALPAYEVQLLIGQGGMGAVYRARHRKLDRLVAIKVLRPLTTDDEAEAAAFTERFEREAQVLAKLDHPHIVRIYDFGRGEGNSPFFYLVLEFVDGASLRELMQSGRLTAPEALALIPQVCEALHTAHALGVVHRDIKPENILVDGDGRVRIADFGLAKLKATDEALPLTQTNQAFGTPHYMAPEQMRSSGTVDHRADLYSLGVVLYELLTGELPLGRFAAPSVKTDAATGLDDVVFRALATEPDERYQGAEEIKKALEDGAPVEGDAKGPEPVVVGGKSIKKARRRARLEARVSADQARQRRRENAHLQTTQTWTLCLVLFLLHFGTWFVVDAQKVFNQFTGVGTRGRLFQDVQLSVDGFHAAVFGIPLWVGLLALLASALLREFRSSHDIEPRLMFRLVHVGTALMALKLISIPMDRSGARPALMFFIVGILFAVNSWIDDGRYRTLKAHAKRLEREQGDLAGDPSGF